MPTTIDVSDDIARAVLAHLCGSTCHGFAEAIELCEMRHDCVIVVTCPSCGKRFALDDDQYDLLLGWTRSQGTTLACGIQPLPV